MINIAIDIETIPAQSAEYRAKVRDSIKPPGNIKKPESIAAWLAENADTAKDEAIAKTSFDPAAGHIVCIGWAHGDGTVHAVTAATVDLECRERLTEREVIISFFDDLPTTGLVRFIGHYISGFDLRFIINRAIVLGVHIPKCIPRDIKPWSQEIFDTMVAWAGPKGTISQDRLAQALGLEGKGDFDGSMVADAWARGEYERISSYCRSDVETVRAIYRKFEAANY